MTETCVMCSWNVCTHFQYFFIFLTIIHLLQYSSISILFVFLLSSLPSTTSLPSFWPSLLLRCILPSIFCSVFPSLFLPPSTLHDPHNSSIHSRHLPSPQPSCCQSSFPVVLPTEPREGNGTSLCSPVRTLWGGFSVAAWADWPHHEEQPTGDPSGPGSAVWTAAGQWKGKNQGFICSKMARGCYVPTFLFSHHTQHVNNNIDFIDTASLWIWWQTPNVSYFLSEDSDVKPSKTALSSMLLKTQGNLYIFKFDLICLVP